MSTISVDGVTYSHHDIRRMRDRGTYEEGAAVAFGLMGMAWAIRMRTPSCTCGAQMWRTRHGTAFECIFCSAPLLSDAE